MKRRKQVRFKQSSKNKQTKKTPKPAIQPIAYHPQTQGNVIQPIVYKNNNKQDVKNCGSTNRLPPTDVRRCDSTNRLPSKDVRKCESTNRLPTKDVWKCDSTNPQSPKDADHVRRWSHDSHLPRMNISPHCYIFSPLNGGHSPFLVLFGQGHNVSPRLLV